MNNKLRQSGLSLMEIVVIIATIALLAALGVPAVRAFIKSFETGSNTKSVISAALSNARAIAVKNQRYAGIRFQKVYQSEGPLNAAQYMIFIIYDPNLPRSVAGNLGCRAIKGLKPIKLPDAVGVMDYCHIKEKIYDKPSWELSSNLTELTNLTTFSILFSQSGKLIIHDLWVRNRDGVSNDSSMDDVFNTETNIRDNNTGMFVQDEEKEMSRNSIIIYENEIFRKAYENGRAWSEYLSGIKPVYINAYTGTIISQD